MLLLVGASEAIVYPVSAVITAMWFTRSEQPIRVAIWFNQFSTIFNGLISFAVGRAEASIAKWKLIFLVLGGITCGWAVVIGVFLPDSPVNCRWMNDREKYVALKRIEENNTGVEEKEGVKWYQVREALLDPKSWLIVLFGMGQNIINGNPTN